MQKIRPVAFILFLFAYTCQASARTGSFQQLSFTAGSGQFGKIIPSVPVKAGPAYSGRFNWGFFTIPRLFVDFGLAFSSFEESYQYTDYNSPTGEIATGKQQLSMLSHMVGTGVCLGNHIVHVLLGAHATLNMMFAENNPHYHIAEYRDIGVGVAPHADISFRVGKHILLGVSGEAMFFPGYNKKQTGLAGNYFGGGIHLQHAH